MLIAGLKVNLNSHKHDSFKAFDYAPAIMYSVDLGPIDWHLLSECDKDCNHIRIHELREGDNLLEFARTYRESHAQAMIVINTTEDFSLSQELSQSLQKLDHFLIAIVPHANGTYLLDQLKKFELLAR